MTKRLFIPLVALLVLLVSCTDAGSEEPTATAPQTAEAEVTQEVSGVRQAQCIAESREATPNPTAQALLPPIDAQDWAKGPDEAHVMVIEYGDYQ